MIELQVDEEQVYYLMSRGIPPQEVLKLSVESSFAPAVDRIVKAEIRAHIRKLIDNKMEK